MHIQTHILSGWCLGNLLELDKRGRTLAMVAGVLPDLDGLGIIFGVVPYWKYHHLVCHNILFELLYSVVLAWFCEKRGKAFLVFLLIFHLHIVMDSFGSGTDWVIRYLWPFSDWAYENPLGWEFFPWQNQTAAGVFVLWTILLIFMNRRTFLEWMMPKLDTQIVSIADRLKSFFQRDGVLDNQ